jgi:hypothetical protein
LVRIQHGSPFNSETSKDEYNSPKTHLARRILELLLEKRALAPGDAVSLTGEPRYRVLASFQCLEELGLIEKVYSRGTYKIYQLSMVGEKLLKKAGAGGIAEALESLVLDLSVEGSNESQASTGT